MAEAANFRKLFALAVTAASLSLLMSGGAWATKEAPRPSNDVLESTHESYRQNVEVHHEKAAEEAEAANRRASSHTLGRWRSPAGKLIAPKLLLASSAIAALMSFVLRKRRLPRETEAAKDEDLYPMVTSPAGLSPSPFLSNKLLLGLVGLAFLASSLAAPRTGQEGGTGEATEGATATQKEHSVDLYYFCRRASRRTCDIVLPPTKRVLKDFRHKTESGLEIHFVVEMGPEFQAQLDKEGTGPAKDFLDSIVKELAPKVEEFEATTDAPPAPPPEVLGGSGEEADWVPPRLRLRRGPHGSLDSELPEGLKVYDLTNPSEEEEAEKREISDLLLKKVHYGCITGSLGPECMIVLPSADRVWKTFTYKKGTPDEISFNVALTTEYDRKLTKETAADYESYLSKDVSVDFGNYLSDEGNRHDPARSFLNRVVDDIIYLWRYEDKMDPELDWGDDPQNSIGDLTRGIIGHWQEKLPDGLELKDLGSAVRFWEGPEQ